MYVRDIFDGRGRPERHRNRGRGDEPWAETPLLTILTQAPEEALVAEPEAPTARHDVPPVPDVHDEAGAGGPETGFGLGRAFVLVLVLALLPPLAAAVLLPAAGSSVTTVEAIACAVTQVVLLLAAVTLYAHWRMTDLATTGWLGAALLVPAAHAAPLILLAVADPAGFGPTPASGPPVVLTTAIALALALCAARQVDLPARVDPLVLGAGVGLAAACLHVGLVRGDVLASGTADSAASQVLLGLITVLTALTLASVASLPRGTRLRFAGGVSAVTLSATLVPLESQADLWWQGLAAGVGLAGAVLVVVSCMELLASAWAVRSWELEDLVARTTTAEATNRSHEEKLHELRSTVAGIASAAQVLSRNDEDLHGLSRERLQRMYDAELGRLERLLTNRPPRPPEVLDLDEVISPLVVTLRAAGNDVRWEPSGCWATGRPDDVAQIVHILLDNAVRHAAGSVITVRVQSLADTVEVRVSDTGRGVTPALVGTVFDRGTQRAGSVGQGIGLNIAHRLATELGGNLRLEQDLPVGGTTFTVSLPAVLTRATCRAHEG